MSNMEPSLFIMSLVMSWILLSQDMETLCMSHMNQPFTVMFHYVWHVHIDLVGCEVF